MRLRLPADKSATDLFRVGGRGVGVGARIRRRASGRGTFEATGYYF